MEKCLVLEGFILMFNIGSAVWSRLIAFCAPAVSQLLL